MIEALETVSRECFRSFGVLRNARVIDDEDATGVVTDMPLTFFNGIGTTYLTARTAGRRIEELIEPFRARDRAFRWWVTPGATPANLRDLLPEHGLQYTYDAVGMTADLEAIPPLPPVRIEQVRDDAAMDVFGEILITVFERPKSEGVLWRLAYGQCGYDDPSPWAHFIAWAGDRPSATASVVMCGEVAGIYLVGSLASARGRGLGSAVTLAALHHARERGARWGALQSSRMGESVYRALGFVSHGMLSMYEWRP